MRLNLTSLRFGRLTCLAFAGTNDSGNAIWRVRCDCGREFIALGTNITSGKTKSCGCLRSELTRKRNLEKRK